MWIHHWGRVFLQKPSWSLCLVSVLKNVHFSCFIPFSLTRTLTFISEYPKFSLLHHLSLLLLLSFQTYQKVSLLTACSFQLPQLFSSPHEAALFPLYSCLQACWLLYFHCWQFCNLIRNLGTLNVPQKTSICAALWLYGNFSWEYLCVSVSHWAYPVVQHLHSMKLNEWHSNYMAEKKGLQQSLGIFSILSFLSLHTGV